jgi:ribosomal protein S18 acetylase RimI-like enzyme
MSNLLDKLECQIKSYKECNEDDRNKILKLLRISFGPDNDPYLLDNITLVIFYYKTHIVGIVSGMENYDLVKHNDFFKENRESYFINYDKKGVFIYNLAVLGTCRKKGLGKALVKILINYFRKIDVEYFHVQINEDNIGSTKIFTDLGFKIRKTLKGGENKNFNLMTLFI